MASAQWPPRELALMERKLDERADLVGKGSNISNDVRCWLARLLVVRACGYLEQVLLAVQRGYVGQKSGGPVSAFAQSWLEWGNNPRPDVLVRSIGRFGGNFEYDIDKFLRDNSTRWSDIAFLVDRRNKISHGENESVGPVRALQLKEVAVEVADWLIRRMNPMNP